MKIRFYILFIMDLMYFLREIFPYNLKTLLDRCMEVSAEAYLSPGLLGKKLILWLNILATWLIE